MENIGQDENIWTNEWKGLNPESEIRMWDYFGLRPWIVKFTPRFGKVLEAGCGLGRYNFYLSNFNIDMIGLDFSKDTISFLNQWQIQNGYNLKFIEGDITNLQFEDSSLSGYLSFGVVEHFIEGPEKPLKEAYRVLRPGGVAIITTPSFSWSKLYIKIIGMAKILIKKLLGRKVNKKPFFQYEYSPRTLKNYIEKQGFYISRYAGSDLLFTFTEFGKFTDKYIKSGTIGYKISHWFENTKLSFLGAQSIVIAIKKDELMHCFLCGNKTATKESLNKYDAPICEKCESVNNAKFYKTGNKVKFHKNYLISPAIKDIENKICELCKSAYETDKLFEDFGFDKNICTTCLKKKENNIYLSNTSLQPVWRKRSLK